MFFLIQNPLLRVFFPFAIGIILSNYVSGGEYLYYSVIFLFALFSVLVFYNKYIAYSRRYIPGIIINILFVFLGLQYSYVFHQLNHESLNPVYENKTNILMVQIVDDVEVKQNSVKTIVRNLALFTDSSSVEIDGKMLIYIRKDSLSKQLKYGDKLLIRTSPKKPDSAMNPYAFDFRKFLHTQGIDHAAWVSENSWKLLSSNNGNALIAFSIKIRNKILDILRNQLGSTDEYRVAAAIICGYRADLDVDLRQTFANAGALHVMCVSGMHVAVIYLVLSKLLFFLTQKKFLTRLIKVVLILLFIWLYSLMTGFSASVLRATAMFSFVALSGLFEKKIPIYNSLAASAILLILINPQNLFNIGFQLSYLAIIGIVSIYPMLKNHMPAKTKIISKFNDLIAVSIAAQIATAPISLFYFNQFPNYFILTNIVAVPVSGFIIYATFPALIFSNVAVLSEIFGFILGLLMKILNYSVALVDQIPYSVTNFIYISYSQMILLYVMIFLLSKFYKHKNSKLVLSFFVVLTLFVAESTINSFKNFNRKEIIIPKGADDALVFAHYNKLNVFAEDINDDFKKKLKNNLSKYLTVSDIKKIKYIDKNNKYKDKLTYFNFPVFQFADYRGLIIDNNIDLENKNQPIKVDMLIFENNPFIKLYELNNSVKSSNYIFSSTNSFRSINAWKRRFDKDKINYHNINEKGSFVVRAK